MNINETLINEVKFLKKTLINKVQPKAIQKPPCCKIPYHQ